MTLFPLILLSVLIVSATNDEKVTALLKNIGGMIIEYFKSEDSAELKKAAIKFGSRKYPILKGKEKFKFKSDGYNKVCDTSFPDLRIALAASHKDELYHRYLQKNVSASMFDRDLEMVMLACLYLKVVLPDLRIPDIVHQNEILTEFRSDREEWRFYKNLGGEAVLLADLGRQVIRKGLVDMTGRMNNYINENHEDHFVSYEEAAAFIPTARERVLVEKITEEHELIELACQLFMVIAQIIKTGGL